MKIIPLKRVEVRMAGQSPDAAPLEFKYSDAILGILNATAAERGVALSEINKALRIIDPIEQAERAGRDRVELEDADWAHLKQAVDAYRGWRIIHRVVEEFSNDIASAVKAPDVPVAPDVAVASEPEWERPRSP